MTIWLIILHMQAASGYGDGYDLYPTTFTDEAACEAHLKTVEYDEYVNRRYPEKRAMRTGRSYWYGECVTPAMLFTNASRG